MPGIASAATSVVIAYIAGGTSRIRVGSGGIMLPNHAPLVIAEQFGTLESLYPGRIDLGLGRAPGTDQATVRALRRDRRASGDTFSQDLMELLAFFQAPAEGQTVRAVPGAGMQIPVWLLGSSDFSATLAAHLGLPFAFASHFAPDYLLHALELYRTQFKPSAQLQQPHLAVGVNVFAAETDVEGRRLMTSLQQGFLNLLRNTPSQLPAPVDTMDGIWNDMEQQYIERNLRVSAIGSRESVRRDLLEILEATRADELILTAQIFDHHARLRSIEIAAEVMQEITGTH
jgi:luciferase family oxidoreductase group 1